MNRKEILDQLINDSYWAVREAVANQGFGLDQSINDSYWAVRKTAYKKLKEVE